MSFVPAETQLKRSPTIHTRFAMYKYQSIVSYQIMLEPNHCVNSKNCIYVLTCTAQCKSPLRREAWHTVCQTLPIEHTLNSTVEHNMILAGKLTQKKKWSPTLQAKWFFSQISVTRLLTEFWQTWILHLADMPTSEYHGKTNINPSAKTNPQFTTIYPESKNLYATRYKEAISLQIQTVFGWPRKSMAV